MCERPRSLKRRSNVMLKATTNRNQNTQSKSHASARTMFEPLEQRQLMSGSLDCTVDIYSLPKPPVLHAPVNNQADAATAVSASDALSSTTTSFSDNA